MKSTHDGNHKYERMKVGKNDHEIYKCMLPGCSHYLPYLELAIGRLSICWGDCGNLVEMDRNLVMWDKIVRPMCDKCKASRRERQLALQAIPEIEDEGGEYEE